MKNLAESICDGCSHTQTDAKRDKGEFFVPAHCVDPLYHWLRQQFIQAQYGPSGFNTNGQQTTHAFGDKGSVILPEKYQRAVELLKGEIKKIRTA